MREQTAQKIQKVLLMQKKMILRMTQKTKKHLRMKMHRKQLVSRKVGVIFQHVILVSMSNMCTITMTHPKPTPIQMHNMKPKK